MIIRTKKYRLTPSRYIRIALWNVCRKQWWVALLTLSLAGGLTYIHYRITAVLLLVGLLLYSLFWWSQFYSLTKTEENQLMFEPLFYEMNRKGVTLFLNTKQGMPIDWYQIASAREGKDYFLLYISMAQFIYLPHSIFHTQQIKLMRMLLNNKKLL